MENKSRIDQRRRSRNDIVKMPAKAPTALTVIQLVYELNLFGTNPGPAKVAPLIEYSIIAVMKPMIA